MKWSDKDVKFLKERGVSVEQTEGQINILKNGFPYMQLKRAAVVGTGIRTLSQTEIEKYSEIFDKQSELTRIKFVPASGAATRMFKALFEFESSGNISGNEKLLENPVYKHIKYFFDHIDQFAFYAELKETLKKEGKDISKLRKEHHYNEILDALLGPQGLNYRNLPKGLLHFHKYNAEVRSPVEEHLVEGAMYAKNADGTVKIHLTVSPEHKVAFEERIQKVRSSYEKQLQVKFEISYSVQKLSTDTIAVDKENIPFREKNGDLLFRPAGHGALLDNLQELNEDIIFIKNIDNVVPDRIKDKTVLYKKVLAGKLIECREKISNYLNILEKGATDDVIKEIKDFVSVKLCTDLGKKMNGNELVDTLRKKLNRPIRVCGMVKNVGEPGGGPFFARNGDGSSSLQIVESSQVDPKDIEQQAMLSSSTHFNPVDIVCCIKDNKGKKFDLKKFVDLNTGFISKKSKDGRSLKALELPGLWNGSMSDWNTIFVEVPIITFNPVKTINDLLRPEHM
jgi:hypothetical protein